MNGVGSSEVRGGDCFRFTLHYGGEHSSPLRQPPGAIQRTFRNDIIAGREARSGSHIMNMSKVFIIKSQVWWVHFRCGTYSVHSIYSNFQYYGRVK